MRKLVLVATLIVITLAAGCAGPSVVTEPEAVVPRRAPAVVGLEPASEEVETNGLVEVEPAGVVEPEDSSEFLPTDKPVSPNTRIGYEHLDKMRAPLEEGFGISEHCDLIGVYPGYSERVPLLIRNGGDKERLFVIYVVVSANPKEGFEALPEEYLSWLTVEESRVELGRDEYCWVYILLAVPKDVDYAGKRAEVRIRVDDITQTGLVQIALESEWYITTAD